MIIHSVFTPIIASLLLFFSLNSSADEIIRIRVKETKVSCMGVAPMECLQVKFKRCQKWQNFHSEIKGFNYQEGFRYTLLVNKKKREHVPADASAYTYELVKIVKQKKKGMPKSLISEPSALAFLAKHKWVLIQLNGKTQESSKVYMIFNPADNTVNGHAGCNRFFGPVEIGKENINFDQLASTRMSCSPEQNKLENEFLSTLGQKELYFDIAEQTLNIYKGDKLIAMFGMNPLME